MVKSDCRCWLLSVIGLTGSIISIYSNQALWLVTLSKPSSLVGLYVCPMIVFFPPSFVRAWNTLHYWTNTFIFKTRMNKRIKQVRPATSVAVSSCPMCHPESQDMVRDMVRSYTSPKALGKTHASQLASFHILSIHQVREKSYSKRQTEIDDLIVTSKKPSVKSTVIISTYLWWRQSFWGLREEKCIFFNFLLHPTSPW